MPSVKLLCQDESVWDVGQGGPEHQPGVHYPDDYAGRVISAIPASWDYFPADTADPRRSVLPLELSDQELADVRSRHFKVGAFGLEGVTFDDRFGAVAVKLREKHPDPESFEREEAAAVKAAQAANLAERERYDLEHLAFEIARKDYVRELVEFGLLDLGLEAPIPPAPPKAPVLTERENAFDLEAAALAKSLPPTVTHTGAGLYKVHAAGTMETPAHLWAMEAVDPTDDGDPGGNPGTGSNVTVVGGQIGSALEFDGNTSNVDVGDVAELTSVQKFTIMFRMNQDVLDQRDFAFSVEKDGSNRILLLTQGTGQFQFNMENGAPAYGRFDYSTRIDAGGWHHVAMVFDGTQTGNANRLKVYTDGIPVTLSFTGTIPATSPDLSGVDATISAAVNAFDGKLDDVRVYADALTDAQVKVLAGRGLAHWDTISAFDNNKALQSERYADDAVWSEHAGDTVTPNATTGPEGAKTADKVVFVADGYRYQLAALGEACGGNTWVVSVWLKGSGIVGLRQANGVGTNFKTVTLSGTWTRHEVVVTYGAGAEASTYIGLDDRASAGGGGTGVTCYCHGWQLEKAASASTYEPTRSATDTSVTLTTGGLTDGDRDGEVFVSGGNGYAVIRNGVDSVLVVGDATGESGTCSVSPYSTFQSAADQLWADQGSSTFTSSQYIRGFAGTYDENVAPNTGLVPDTDLGFWFFLEGDPADDRDNIVIAPSGGTDGVLINTSDGVVIRHLKFAGTPASYMIRVSTGALYFHVLDCHVVGAKSSYIYFLAFMEDCHFEIATTALSTGGRTAFIRGCRFEKTGAKAGTAIEMFGNQARIESSVAKGYTNGFGRAANAAVPVGTEVINCTFYDCTYATDSGWTAAAEFWIVTNCIFKDVDYIFFRNRAAVWPEETSTRIGPHFLLRNNCYHGYTAIGYDGVTPKSYAEWIAFNQVDAAGDLDATDPLMTDPGSGDFSLQGASPCRNTGHGSGVLTGINDAAFDAHHPDIGAWSSGALTVGAPTIGSIADDGTTTSVTLSLGADHAQDVLSVRYAKTSDATWTLFGSTRTGPGTLQITGLAVGWYDFCCVAARGGEVSLPSRSVRFAVMATTLASAGAALNALLRADATLAALVGDHIYPQAAPERAKPPYVVSTRVGGTPAHTIAAAAGFVEARFQIDSYGATLEDAHTIADAVRNILDGYRGTVSAGSAQLVVGSIRRDVDIDAFTEPAFAGGVGRHRVVQDYLMTHEESVPAFA